MHRAALAALLTLVACAGGSSSPPETPAPARTTKALTCFWYMDMGAAVSTADYTSCVEAGGFTLSGQGAGLEQLATLSQAAGRQVLLSVPSCEVPVDQVEPEVTFWLDRVFKAGYLKNIVAIRFCDEADDKGISEADMLKIVTGTHAAMAKFDETRAKPLAMYYTCGGKTRPGIEYVDWMGCDRYDHGCAVFAEAYGLFESYVNKEPDRKLMAIDGLSDPFRQDPTCMVDRVLRDGRFALFEIFAYQSLVDRGNAYTGVRDNGTEPLARAQMLRLR